MLQKNTRACSPEQVEITGSTLSAVGENADQHKALHQLNIKGSILWKTKHCCMKGWETEGRRQSKNTSLSPRCRVLNSLMCTQTACEWKSNVILWFIFYVKTKADWSEFDAGRRNGRMRNVSAKERAMMSFLGTKIWIFVIVSGFFFSVLNDLCFILIMCLIFHIKLLNQNAPFSFKIYIFWFTYVLIFLF